MGVDLEAFGSSPQPPAPGSHGSGEAGGNSTPSSPSRLNSHSPNRHNRSPYRSPSMRPPELSPSERRQLVLDNQTRKVRWQMMEAGGCAEVLLVQGDSKLANRWEQGLMPSISPTTLTISILQPP